MVEGRKLPFLYRVEHLKSTKSKEIESAYKQLIKDLPSDHYNFIVNSKAACVVPRKSAIDERGIVLNSIGLCGIFSLWYNADPYVFKHPMDIISQVCFPSE